MSRPGPNSGPPRPYDWQRQFRQPDYRQHQQPETRQYPQRGNYPEQQSYREPVYEDDPYRQPSYREQERYQSYDSYDSYDQPYRPEPPQRRPTPQEMYPDEGGFGLRLPGIGLLLSLAGIAVQLVCMLVLPWVSASAAGGKSLTLPQLWDIATEANAQGFGGWYLVLFSYPLAALGIVLALVSVIESVVGKVLFAVLAVLGIGYLVVRYGVGPAAGLFGEEQGAFSRGELVTLGIAAGALVIVLSMAKMGLAMFRRIAGLILLVMAGVHVYAVQDLFAGGDSPSFGAYGPALGYALSGVAALIGPRRLTPG
jgi:hypothetical protein